MNALRSILLHLDASPRSATRMLLARELALQCGATLTALYATTPGLLDMPFALAAGAAGALDAVQRLDAERRDEARRLYDRSASAVPAPPMQWRELQGDPVVAGVARHALLADLLVLGQHDGGDPEAAGVPADLVASVLIGSGRPALVVPYAGRFDRVGRDVLLAWKPTRESARALSAALPLLQRARRIHLSADSDADEVAGAPAVQAYLRQHGIALRVERHAAVPADMPGEGLLSLAADVGADLLVMGCYGHSRARELVLGGASRTILKSMTLPVLMAH